ncbi:MAG: hypothetical protein RLN88_00600 [Ekhidna sp.]|uniref:hypothetical protein n=1 Tax=Ekhidna sp. TaxID=2608089 RepID=UPI0032EE69FE
MRQFLFLAFLSHTLISFSQRITFNDPDLSFSFKKPKDWQVFDDGLVVKVSPSAADSSRTYFSITYFEDAEPFGEFPLVESQPETPPENLTPYPKKIAGQDAKYQENNSNELSATYVFYTFGQRFLIVTVQSLPEDQAVSQAFNRMIRSIKVTDPKK